MLQITEVRSTRLEQAGRWVDAVELVAQLQHFLMLAGVARTLAEIAGMFALEFKCPGDEIVLIDGMPARIWCDRRDWFAMSFQKGALIRESLATAALEAFRARLVKTIKLRHSK